MSSDYKDEDLNIGVVVGVIIAVLVMIMVFVFGLSLGGSDDQIDLVNIPEGDVPTTTEISATSTIQ
ncbi:MAG: hypothetical protein AAB821_01150 [Patescibacteria group bacterium]